jgi:catechol 2,3-dioxygenase-like lactoylglutathione lyase family enzyme
MPVELNHTIVPAVDGERSARWFSETFGLPEPTPFEPFWQVRTANDVDLDFDTYGPQPTGDAPQFTIGHYAFLVTEAEFDEIFARIVAGDGGYWADPARSQPRTINHHDGGRGVYFENPDGHLFEIITRPYGG